MGSGAAEATVSHAVAGGGVTVHIRCFNGSKFSVRISLNSTVGSLKSVVAQNCDVAAERQRLIYKGRVLKDDHTLESYGIVNQFSLYTCMCNYVRLCYKCMLVWELAFESSYYFLNFCFWKDNQTIEGSKATTCQSVLTIRMHMLCTTN